MVCPKFEKHPSLWLKLQKWNVGPQNLAPCFAFEPSMDWFKGVFAQKKHISYFHGKKQNQGVLHISLKPIHLNRVSRCFKDRKLRFAQQAVPCNLLIRAYGRTMGSKSLDCCLGIHVITLLTDLHTQQT